MIVKEIMNPHEPYKENHAKREKILSNHRCSDHYLIGHVININLRREFSMPEIIDAGMKAARSPNGTARYFSINDVYSVLGFLPTRSVTWSKRFTLLPPGRVRAVLKGNGFGSIKKSGGANVCRYYLIPVVSENGDISAMGGV